MWASLPSLKTDLEQVEMVVKLISGTRAYGRVIEGEFCEYYPDKDRFVQSHAWEHIAGFITIPTE
jgi:hypothetical protein